MNDSFYKINIDLSEKFINELKKIIQTSKDKDWSEILELTRLNVSIELFKLDPNFFEIVNHFGAEKRISIFRTNPNTVYNWHTDPTREASINFLIDGFDSKCIFAEKSNGRHLINLEVLEYNNKNPFILNTSKLHSVLNMNNLRYVLSIGIPRPSTFEDVVGYVKKFEK